MKALDHLRQQWIRSLTRSSQNPIDGGVLPKVRRAGTSVRPKEGRQEGVLSIRAFFSHSNLLFRVARRIFNVKRVPILDGAP